MNTMEKQSLVHQQKGDTMISNNPSERKKIPIYRAFIKYFPDAIVEVTKQSMKGNEQHHPQSEIHWDKSKSADELDSLMRHMIEEDWVAVAWRGMANLQRELDKKKGNK